MQYPPYCSFLPLADLVSNTELGAVGRGTGRAPVLSHTRELTLTGSRGCHFIWVPSGQNSSEGMHSWSVSDKG